MRRAAARTERRRRRRSAGIAPRIERLALLAVLTAALPGCAWFRTLARPDPTPAPPESPWTVACMWADVTPPAPGGAPGPRENGTARALDPNGRRIALDGALEDGFLRVDGASAWTAERGREPLGVEPTPRGLEWLCRDTLAREHPGARIAIDRVVAERGDGVPVPIAFAAAPLDGGPRGTARRIVVFGDSLSDPGNLKERLKLFPASPYYLGRFSDGPNWVDHLQAHSGIPAYNHAVGGAISTPHPDVPAASILSAIQQGGQYLLTGSVDEYVQDYVEKDLVGGQVQRTNDTVFVLWSGANDYLSKEPISGEIETLLDSPRSESGYLRVMEQTIDGIGAKVHRLHAAGARRFVVVTLPDLGRVPGVLSNESYRAESVDDPVARRAQLSRRLSGLTEEHNAALAQRVERLREEMPGSTIVLTDSAASVDAILAGRRPRSAGKRGARFDYGFDLRSLRSDELRDRRGVIPIQDRCYAGGYLGASDPAQVCSGEAAAFFWDSVHPTSYTHCWIAYFVERDLARAGLVAEEPDIEEYRDFCVSRR